MVGKNNGKKVIKFSLLMLSAVCMFVSGCSNSNPSTVSNDPSYDIVRPTFTPDYDNYGVNEKHIIRIFILVASLG